MEKKLNKDKNVKGVEQNINIAQTIVSDIQNEANKLLSENSNDEITGEQLLQHDIQKIPYLVEPFFQQVGLACLAGSSDTGKSSLLRHLAISISAGEKTFLGFKINAKFKSVIFVSTEDGKEPTAYLLQQQAKQYKPTQLRDLRFIFDYENLLEKLRLKLNKKPADLVIIDCFSDVFAGDLKDTQAIRTYLSQYQQLADKYQCLILFLHHTGKRTENFEPSKNNLLSGQGLEAKMRLVIELRADLTNPFFRHFCIVKGNYLSATLKKESYVLQFDELTFTFSNTGERIPFEFLKKQPEEDNGKEKYEQVMELKLQGKNYEQIAQIMGYSSKGTITKLIQKAKEKGWDLPVSNFVSNGNRGNKKGNIK